MAIPSKQYIRWIFALLVGGYAIYLLWVIFLHPQDYHWDLKTYYLAAEAVSHGDNPYDQSALARYTSGPTPLKFVYPPLTLVLFRILTLLDYASADRLWLLLQVIMLVVLALLWRRGFLGKNADLLFWLFCLIAYNSPLYSSVKSGNIVLLEQVLLWGAFAGFVRERYLLFSVLLCAASLFKLTPILFAVAILFTDVPRRGRYLVFTIAAFAAIQLATFLAAPAMYRDFLSSAGTLEEWGLANPSTYPLVVELFRAAFGERVSMIPPVIPLSVYIALSVAVLSVALPLLARVQKARLPERRLVVTFMLMLVYVLVLPRSKNYSYTFLLPVTYWIMKQKMSLTVYTAIFILSAFTIFRLPVLEEFALILWTYIPLLTAFAVFVLYVSWIRENGDSQLIALAEKVSQ